MQVKLKYDTHSASEQLAEFLSQFITKDTIIICIGSDKSRADSLAPLVGTLLYQERYPLKVYGKLGDTVHALNLETVLEEVKTEYPDSTFIGIDACVGNEVGNIYVRDYPIRPGAGVGKTLPDVGVASIVGTTLTEDDVFALWESIEPLKSDSLEEIKPSVLYQMAFTILRALQISYEKIKERL